MTPLTLLPNTSLNLSWLKFATSRLRPTRPTKPARPRATAPLPLEPVQHEAELDNLDVTGVVLPTLKDLYLGGNKWHCCGYTREALNTILGGFLQDRDDVACYSGVLTEKIGVEPEDADHCPTFCDLGVTHQGVEWNCRCPSSPDDGVEKSTKVPERKAKLNCLADTNISHYSTEAHAKTDH